MLGVASSAWPSCLGHRRSEAATAHRLSVHRVSSHALQQLPRLSASFAPTLRSNLAAMRVWRHSTRAA